MNRRNQQSGGLLSGIGRGISQYMSEPDPPPPPRNTSNAAGKSADELAPIPGLAELIELLNVMAAAPHGVRPPINQELPEKIKNTPMHPVLKALQPVYKKLGPPENSTEQPQRPDAGTPQPTTTPLSGPSSGQPPPSAVPANTAELENIEAGLKSVSSKLDAVSQGVADVAKDDTVAASFQMLEGRLLRADSETREAVKVSANAAKTQFETVDTKVSQMSGKLDPALAELKLGMKNLEAGLLGDVRNERTRLEAKVTELEKEVKDLQQVIEATKAELLPVEAASKVTLQGTFSDEVEKASNRAGSNNAAGPGAVVQTAKRVRANTFGLITKCRALFAFINRDPQTGPNTPDLGTEGEWGRCADHLRASNSRLRSVIEEKEESAQKLQFVGFVVDQMRKGHYTEKEWKNDHNGKNFVTLLEKSPDGFANIQLLAQDLSRLTATAMAAQTVATAPADTVATTTTRATTGAPTTTHTTAGATNGPKTTTDTPNPSKTNKGAPTTSRTAGAPASTNATTGASATTNTATVAPNAADSAANTSSATTTAAQNRPTTGGSRGTRTRGTPTTNQSAAAITPTIAETTAPLTPPATAGLKGPKATSKGSKAPITPVTPVTPQSPPPPVEVFEPPPPTPVVTAPSSPAGQAIPVPVPVPVSPRQDADVRPTSSKRTSSYRKSKSDFSRKFGPLSGWGPLAA